MDGRLLSSGEPDLYFTTSPETDTGYGDTAIPVRVRPERLHLDDEFPGGRRDYSVPAPSRSRRLRFLPDGSAELKQRGVDSAGADAQAAQREHAVTERVYGGRAAYEVAKAAGRTKLNFFQWVQVRTPRFKQWFGDWEAARGVKELAVKEPHDLSEQAALDGKKAIEQAFRSFGPVETVDGRSVTFPVGMAGKISRHKGFDVGRVAGAFDVLLRDAIPMMSQAEQAREGHKNHSRNVVAYHHYVNRFEQGGREYYIRFTVQGLNARPGTSGQDIAHSSFVSDVEVYGKEKGAAPESASFRENPVLADGTAPVDAILARWIEDGNGETVSNVTDPDTGEPLVVHHGSPDARFLDEDATFKSQRDRYGGAMGRAEAAHWFASSRRVASTYADDRRAFDYQNAEPGVIDAWLQLKNPLVIDAGGAHWRTAQQSGKTSDVIEQARKDGHDGVIIRRVRDDYSTLESGKRGEIADTYAVFSSPQIKSATANVGTFSQDDGNILHQVGLTPTAQAMQRWRDALKFARPDRPDYAPKLDTPTVLREMGVKQGALGLPTRVLMQIINKHPDVPTKVIENLPALLADPIAIYPHKDGGWRVVIDAVTKAGEPIIVGIGERIQTITPVHDKDGITGAERVRMALEGAASRRGTKVYARNKEAPANAGASAGAPSATIALRRDSLSKATVVTRDTLVKRHGTDFYQGQAAPRGSFSRDSLTVKLLHGADLTTVMHEGAHFFFENDIAMATELAAEARTNGIEALKPGERQILADVSALFRRHGIQGDIIDQLDQWHSMSPEEQRAHHERTAEWFETYLASGKAPSIELQPYFRKFRQWFLNVYGSVKRFIDRNPEAGKINDEVRGVFDRMLATNEQIVLAEQARSMIPIFETAEQAGMRPEEFQAYQALNMGQTQKAVEELQARALDDMRWIRGIRSRAIKKLTREERERRSQMRIEARREVMSQPVYIAGRFLTGKITKDDRIGPLQDAQSNPDHVMPDRDSLFTAIAKLGGIDRAEVKAQWGVDQKTQIAMPVFGKPVMRKTGGRSIDRMGQALAEEGYLSVDEHGKYDMGQFEDMFFAELRGDVQYSMRFNPDTKADGKLAGEQVANPGALGAGRIDAASLQFMDLPDGVADAIRARGMTAANGLHPDILADTIGFSSGDELLQALAAARPPQEVIETLTQERMVQRFGDLATPEAIEQAADRAVHNEVRTRMLEAEANALSRAVGRLGILRDAARELASQIVARTRVRDLLPQKYANSASRAGKAAQAARSAGNIAQAAMEKRNQLINTYAARAAYDAREEFDKGLRYLRRFTGGVKNMDPAYVDQIHKLLERFNLRPMSRDKMDERASFVDWLQAQEEAGTPPDIDPALVAEANRKPVKEMSVEEFRGLIDAVRQIAHLGRLKNRLMTDKKRREYQAVRDEMVASINDHARGRMASNLEPVTKGEKAEKGARKFIARSLTMSNIARILDGGDENGPVWRYLVRPANEASNREATMNADATLALSKILAPVIRLGGTTGKGKYFASVGRSFNREQRFVVALNWGNEGNRQRMLDGEGWTAEQIRPVLESLTEAEWQAAQQVWDYLNTTYRPLIAAKERRVFGREPKWVEAAPFTIRTADGKAIDLQGGYYPIRFNPERSLAAAQHSAAEEARQQLRGAYTSATTRRSFTKARADEVKADRTFKRPALALFMEEGRMNCPPSGPSGAVHQFQTPGCRSARHHHPA